MGKAILGNDDATKRNLERSMQGVHADNFRPVFVSNGAKTALVRLLRELPKSKR